MLKKVLLFSCLVIASKGFAQDAKHAAFNAVIRHEDRSLSGVVTKEPFGGEARLGINSKANPKAVSDGFYTMPRRQAISYAYRLFVARYWNAIHGDQIMDPAVGLKVVDLAYNMGPVRAIRLVQTALNVMGAGLLVTGRIDEATLSALNTYALMDSGEVIRIIADAAVDYYNRLCVKMHMMHSPWRQNWIARAREI
jgi:lysozyme family protein